MAVAILVITSEPIVLAGVRKVMHRLFYVNTHSGTVESVEQTQFESTPAIIFGPGFSMVVGPNVRDSQLTSTVSLQL
jgi:hypothetical protein